MAEIGFEHRSICLQNLRNQLEYKVCTSVLETAIPPPLIFITRFLAGSYLSSKAQLKCHLFFTAFPDLSGQNEVSFRSPSILNTNSLYMT